MREKHDLRLRLEVCLMASAFDDAAWLGHLLYRNQKPVNGVEQPMHRRVRVRDLDATRRLVEHAVARYDRARTGPILHLTEVTMLVGKGERNKAKSRLGSTYRFPGRGERLLVGTGDHFDDMFPAGGPAEQAAAAFVRALEDAVEAKTINKKYTVHR
jgi:hypothetical protein